MRRTVNVRILGVLLGTVVVLGAVVHGLHAYQRGRQQSADALSRMAQRALDKGQFARAVTYLERYLSLIPGDTDALVKLGQTLDRLAEDYRGRFRALQVLEQALRREPGRRDLRRRVVSLAIDQFEFRTAIAHLDRLLPEAPDEEKGDLEHLLGWCQDAEEHYEEAVAAFRRAVKYAPRKIPSYVLLAEVLKDRLFRQAEAAAVMNAMVAANPGTPEAYLARARFLQGTGDLPGATRDLARARQLEPKRTEVTLAAADLARARGSLREARALLQQALKQHPQDATLCAALADVELRDGRPAQAIACLEQGVKEMPAATDLLILLADLLLDQGNRAEASALIERLQALRPPPPRTSYLQARVRMQEGRWDEAVALLESVRPRLAGVAVWASQVDICLGQCHEKLGDTEAQLAAFRRAVRSNPSAAVAQYGLGTALLAAGQVEEAVAELRKLARGADAPPATWIAFTRALITRNRRLPPGQRDWREVQSALERAAADPEDVQVTVLRAEALAGQGQLDPAISLVKNALQRDPAQAPLWTTLADLFGQQGRADAAQEVFQRATARPELAGNGTLLGAQVRYWAGRQDAGAGAELARLEQQAAGLTAVEQVHLLRELAEAHGRRGELAEALRLWKRVATERPRDLASRVALFDLALASGQDAAAEQVVKDIRRLDGAAGLRWRCAEATRLVTLARRDDEPRLAAAGQLLDEINAAQKNHPAVPLLRAGIEELRRNDEAAIKHYRQALELGERQARVYHRLTQLLTERRRFADAHEVVRQAEGNGALSPELARRGAEAALGVRDGARALQLARQAVPLPARDYRDALWLAEILEAVGEPTESEQVLRRTLRQAAAVPDVWAALVGVLTRMQRTAEAEALISQARQKLPPDRLALGLARCFEALGNLDRARAEYQEALEIRPDDARLLRAAAEFCRRTDQPRYGEMFLRKLLAAPQLPADQVPWARRQLALVLAEVGTRERYDEALALLDRNADPRGRTGDEERARAVVLASQPGQQREALRRYEASLKGQPITADDAFLLARLCDAAGQRERVRPLMLDVLATHPNNPQYLAFYLRCLIEQGERAGVQFYLARLERIEPASARVRVLKALLSGQVPG
jgi:tetratricopeptide (TPR) repeat protein